MSCNSKNLGLCNKCFARVPAEFETRGGQVWIRKHCPTCGQTESMVSSDAAAWQGKRSLWDYVQADPKVCALKCDACHFNHKPNIVFIDVTNRCNMHCPICIATIKRMGYDYNPPLEYFEKIFAHISQFKPMPAVQLFGGEPTVREDLLDIIALGRKYGLKVSVTTNGLRLADEEYCKKLCDAKVGVRFAFDGFSADVYEKLRHNRPAYFKKLKGLANLKKYSRRKHMLLGCAAVGVNDHCIPGMIQYVHDNRDWISELGIIPLADTWDRNEMDMADATTPEDVERMVKNAFPPGEVEFVPAGMSYLMRIPRRFFRDRPSDLLLLAGVHPNCESMTALISDGRRFHGINYYLKVPFVKAAREFAELCRKIEPKLNSLDPTKFFQKLRGQWLVMRTFAGWALRTVDFMKLTAGNPLLALAKMVMDELKLKWARSRGQDPTTYRRKRRMVRVAMLPFVEQHTLDASRLENCKAVFTYEDTDTGRMESIPTCMWPPYRDIVLKKIAQKYGTVDAKGRLKAGANGQDDGDGHEAIAAQADAVATPGAAT